MIVPLASDDPDAQDSDGYSALMWAVHWENHEVVRMLVENGADLALTNSAGDTALALADSNGNTEMVELLHSLGAEDQHPWISVE